MFFAKAAEHGEDGFALFFLLGSVGFDVVVVVGEERGGIGFGGGAESYIEVVFADRFQPNGVDHIVGIVVVGANGFVDDIPRMNAAFVAASDGLDVGAQQCHGVFGSSSGFEPGGIVVVPAEIVAAREDLMRFGKVHERVSVGEVVTVRFGMRGAPFHIVFGDEDGAL